MGKIKHQCNLEGDYKETKEQFNVLWEAAMMWDI